MCVAIFDCDVTSSGLVCRRCERTRQRRMLQVAVDENVLTFADVGSDTNGELRIASQEVVVGHGHIPAYV